MKNIARKLGTLLMIISLAIITNAAFKDQRLTLKNGEAKENVTLNPSRTYRFVIDGKQFTKLSIQLTAKGGKIQVEIKSPSGKTLSSGTGQSFTIRKGEKVEKGDYQIILKNIGDSLASVGMKIGDIKGESTE